MAANAAGRGTLLVRGSLEATRAGEVLDKPGGRLDYTSRCAAPKTAKKTSQ
jgi:hypothetical protein